VSRPLLLDASVWLAALDRDDPYHGPARRWTLISGDIRDLVIPGLAVPPDAAAAGT
jgi:predicted nucleic acid-binding protein